MRCCSLRWSASRCSSTAPSISGFPIRRTRPPSSASSRGEGGCGGHPDRGVRRRDRTADRLDDACAMGLGAARPAPPGLFPPVAPGAGDHRVVAARRGGQGAAQDLAPEDGCDRQRRGFLKERRLHRSQGARHLVQSRSFPQGIRTLHDAGERARGQERRGHRRRDQPEADLGRHHRVEDRRGRLRLCRRRAWQADRPSRHQPGIARHRFVQAAAGRRSAGAGAGRARRQAGRDRSRATSPGATC